jgi:predicted HD phosphohydrolase
MLAEEDGASDSLIAAALLHDYGHLVELRDAETADAPPSDDKHELIAADVLATVFGPDVLQPIALHVAAKRYLCQAEPGYLEGLSDASVHSLGLQGGAFTPDQAALFLRQPYAEDAVRLRRYDDQGKRPGWEVCTFERYRPLLERVRLP